MDGIHQESPDLTAPLDRTPDAFFYFFRICESYETFQVVSIWPLIGDRSNELPATLQRKPAEKPKYAPPRTGYQRSPEVSKYQRPPTWD
jgi:hypothetical protein